MSIMPGTRYRFVVGDVVVYTPAAERLLFPPIEGAEGVVEEVDDHRLLVRWPMGLAYEYPRHIRRAKEAA